MSARFEIPAYDPDLIADVGRMPSAVTNEQQFREWRAEPLPGLDELRPALDELGLVHEEHVVAVPGGKMVLSVVRPRTVAGRLPALYLIHGGGMIAGNRFGSFLPDVLTWIVDHGIVVVSPEYTLAPEQRAPQAAMECYAGLRWVAEHAIDLSIDDDRLVLAGGSGGGGLAASVSLLARDNGGPGLLAQMLLCPQLGDRHDTVSSEQFTLANGAIDPWPSETNRYAWNALLGEGHEDADVSIYASPARADDLSGLPQAFIDVGGNEVFRDADLAYASRLWQGGVNVEVHVWPGGYHSFDFMVPDAPVSIAAKAARTSWLERIFAAAAG
ncbi:esterase [Frondihabitans sucicola]|uniref:Esterase n=1 Tax=Frondihabitans sucicola TaxID=1268041 RepID=A0ABM8GKC8_9MICO|nr:alpha/beta hydrolase fold domain-containing protein [Frondihabitans sucicola]BDZ48847.1 esterase [Frondihabitans sucicola]